MTRFKVERCYLVQAFGLDPVAAHLLPRAVFYFGKRPGTDAHPREVLAAASQAHARATSDEAAAVKDLLDRHMDDWDDHECALALGCAVGMTDCEAP